MQTEASGEVMEWYLDSAAKHRHERLRALDVTFEVPVANKLRLLDL